MYCPFTGQCMVTMFRFHCQPQAPGFDCAFYFGNALIFNYVSTLQSQPTALLMPFILLRCLGDHSFQSQRKDCGGACEVGWSNHVHLARDQIMMAGFGNTDVRHEHAHAHIHTHTHSMSPATYTAHFSSCCLPLR